MEVNAVGSHGGVVRLNAAEQARQLADARQTALLHEQGVTVKAPSSPVVSNPSFSPALYAQAAQYQLYTQSGVLASLAQSHVAATPPVIADDPDAISPVEEAHGGSVNTLA